MTDKRTRKLVTGPDLAWSRLLAKWYPECLNPPKPSPRKKVRRGR